MKNRLLFLWASCFIVLFTSFDVHEVYISSLQMEWKQQSGEIQLTLQLFTDDLETVLQSRTDSRIQLDPDNQSVDSLLVLYLNEVLTLSYFNIPIPISYLGKKYQDDLSRIFISVPLPEAAEKVDMEYQLFLKQFPSQQNVVHFKNGSYLKSYLFDRQNRRYSIFLSDQ